MEDEDGVCAVVATRRLHVDQADVLQDGRAGAKKWVELVVVAAAEDSDDCCSCRQNYYCCYCYY